MQAGGDLVHWPFTEVGNSADMMQVLSRDSLSALGPCGYPLGWGGVGKRVRRLHHQSSPTAHIIHHQAERGTHQGLTVERPETLRAHGPQAGGVRGSPRQLPRTRTAVKAH